MSNPCTDLESLLRDMRTIALSHAKNGEARTADILERARERILELAKLCDHSQWEFAKHGRVCPCGKFMRDFGD